MLAAALLAATLGLERWLAPGPSLAARLALPVLSVPALLRLRLVTGYDLEKLGSLPLTTGWMRRALDTVLGAATRLARAIEPGGAT